MKPIYAIIGQGRWGNRLLKILRCHDRHTIQLNISRPRNQDEIRAYQDQIVQHINQYAKKVISSG